VIAEATIWIWVFSLSCLKEARTTHGQHTCWQPHPQVRGFLEQDKTDQDRSRHSDVIFDHTPTPCRHACAVLIIHRQAGKTAPSGTVYNTHRSTADLQLQSTLRGHTATRLQLMTAQQQNAATAPSAQCSSESRGISARDTSAYRHASACTTWTRSAPLPDATPAAANSCVMM
jgi:hypothetical protein